MSNLIKKFRCGKIEATIWENEIEINENKIKTLNTKIEKQYKDKDGNWQKTNQYNKNELADIYFVTLKAIDFVKIKEENIEKENKEE